MGTDTKCWVIEQNMGYGEWSPMVCEGEVVAHINYYGAHKLKRQLVDTWWCLNRREEKENFRIREYKPSKKR